MSVSILLARGSLKTGAGCPCMKLNGCWVLALLMFQANLACFKVCRGSGGCDTGKWAPM